MLTIFAVSDATGETAERVARAALVQFPEAQVEIRRRAAVRSPELVRAVVDEAAGCDGIVFHSLVSYDLRRLMLREIHVRGLDSMDLMGPVLDRFATHLKVQPQEVPGLFEQLSEAKSREIEAVDFAFHHDDGQNTGDLHRAEIVLVGPSRTMKTPTMLYLAYRGWFAANVPLYQGVVLPPALLALPPRQVFGLHIDPERLLDLRHARAQAEKIPPEAYASPANIRAELALTREICTRHGWMQLDVTGKSVEELSREIIAWAGEPRG
jgi:hypothetical protein